MSNMGFLVVAYLAIWGGVFAYLMYIGSRQHRLSMRLNDLETAMTEEETRP
jgi:CcmD family protein